MDFLSLLGLGGGLLLPLLFGGSSGGGSAGPAQAANDDSADATREALEELRRERNAAASIGAEGAYSEAAIRARERRQRETSASGFGSFAFGSPPPSSVAYRVAFGE